MGLDYVAVKPCGCISGLASEKLPPKELAKAVAKWIARGCSIERRTTEEIRQCRLYCDQHNQRQRSLL